jgi:hypothetical protein
VPNSLTQQAIPQGFFKGLSKHTYDVLFKQTRGAIKPVRQIQMTKAELMQLTGLSENTISAHISHLRSVGLIQTSFTVGKHQGAIYEVFVPEELTLTNPSQPDPTQPNLPQAGLSSPNTSQQLGRDTPQLLGGVGGSKIIENKHTYEASKTLLKTIRQSDDEKPFSRAIEKLEEAARATTGRGLTKSDLEAFENIVDLLIDMTTVAATKTDSVTTYLKFAEANLKKRLATAQRIFEKKPTKAFEPGSPLTGELPLDTESTFEAEPLTEEQRENALVIYRPLFQEKGTAALENGRWQFTSEDYEWLLEKLANN